MATLSDIARDMNDEKKDALPAEEKVDALDTLRPMKESRTWEFTDEDDEVIAVYVQKPLTFFSKMEFFALLGKALDDAMKGDNALDVGALFAVATPGANQEAEAVMVAIAKLAVYVPDLLKDCYCIWLGVPRDQREYAKEVLAISLSDDEAFEIIDIFLAQNSEALTDFFVKRLPALWATVQKRVQPEASQSSKRLSRTRGRTPKR